MFAAIWQTLVGWQAAAAQGAAEAANGPTGLAGQAALRDSYAVCIVLIFIPYTCKLLFHIVCIPRSQAFVFCLNLPVLEYLEL